MLNPVREGERIEAIRYRRRLKIFENFLLLSLISPELVRAARSKQQSFEEGHSQAGALVPRNFAAHPSQHAHTLD